MKTFKWKVLTSFLLTLSFFSASVSGVLLYFTPRGRIANWTEWTIAGLTKVEWTNIHITAVAVMLITALLHLFWFNWKVFLAYLSKTASGAILRYPRELAIAVVVFLLVTIGTMVELPGVFALIDGRTAVEDSFELTENQPPVPHAEILPLRQFSADVLKKPVDEVLARLKNLGWEATADERLVDVANRYGVSPQTIYEQLQKAPAVTGTGMGWGRMTLRQVAEANNLDLNLLISRAKELGSADLTGDESVKEIAEGLGMIPSEFLPKLDKSLVHP